MTKKIPLNNLRISNDLVIEQINRAIHKVITSGNYLFGKETKKFSVEWSKYCGQKFCIPCKNGTDALSLAAKALNIKKAIVQANTIPLTAQGLYLGGAKITISDVNTDGRSNIISKNLVPVLLYGRQPTKDELKSKIFDAAHAHGWKPPKHAVACWSFYPTKILGGMGDSGAVTTNDPLIAKKIAELSGSRDILNNPKQINSRIDEIQASILRIKLKFLDEYIFERRKIASLYQENLINTVRIVSSVNNDFHHLLVIYAPHNRDKLKRYLLERGIETKVHYPIPLNKIKSTWFNKKQLENANIWSEHILSLPMFIGIKKSTIITISKAINNFYKNN